MLHVDRGSSGGGNNSPAAKTRLLIHLLVVLYVAATQLADTSSQAWCCCVCFQCQLGAKFSEEGRGVWWWWWWWSVGWQSVPCRLGPPAHLVTGEDVKTRRVSVTHIHRTISHTVTLRQTWRRRLSALSALPLSRPALSKT